MIVSQNNYSYGWKFIVNMNFVECIYSPLNKINGENIWVAQLFSIS